MLSAVRHCITISLGREVLQQEKFNSMIESNSDLFRIAEKNSCIREFLHAD